MSTVIDRLTQPALAGVKPYVPGPTREDIAIANGLDPQDVIKLSSNENPLGVPPRALEAIARCAAGASEYPLPLAPRLRQKIAEFNGVAPEQVVCGSGSSELHMILIKAFSAPGDEIISFDPSFTWYAEAAQADGRTSVITPLDEELDVDTDQLLDRVTDKTRIIFLPRPNNPTSKVTPLALVDAIAEQLPNTLVVSDEAYIEFAPDFRSQSAVNLLPHRPNVLVSRTFSKAFGLAGLRVGYVLGSVEAITALAKAKPKWNVGTVAEAAAIAALEDEQHLNETIEVTRKGRDFFYAQLPQLGLKVVPDAGGNFIMVDVAPTGMSARELSELILKKGIAIRGDFSDRYVRISIGTPSQNKSVVSALESVMADTSSS